MAAFTTRPTLRGTFGMVASTHYVATAAGQSVLERGGNAADAAVATALTLHVVEPHLNGPAGDAPILISRDGEAPRVLCGQGPAPAGATIAHLRDELGLAEVPGTGPLAAAIPGAFDAWMLLLAECGTWRLRDVFAYAIHYAEAGHDPMPQLCATVAGVAGLFAEHWPTSAALWLGPDGPASGRLFRNPALAATWRRLIAEAEATASDRVEQIDAARAIWREGFIADALVRQAERPTRDSSGADHSGVLTRADLAGWSASWEAPVSARWGEWTVYKCGAWSQGPAFLQQLALLGDVAPGDLFAAGTTPDVVHRLVESAKLALADRDAWYGDADPAGVPLDALLSPAYASARRRLITETASAELRPGAPGGVDPRLPRYRLGDEPEHPAHGEPTVRADGLTRGDTCHLDVIDAEGTLISATASGGWLQSNPTVPELGFPLGTRLQMTWLQEGLASSLTPGRRPRTTLSPSIAAFDGTPTLAFGTPGGDQQDQWSLHFFARVADEFARTGRLEPQAAIDAVNWHTDALISSFAPRAYQARTLAIEGRADEALVAGLRKRGHAVTVGEPWSEGRLCAVGRDPLTGIYCAAANPRGMQAYAAGR